MPTKTAERAANKPSAGKHRFDVPRTPKQPRDQALPGLEEARHVTLDSACATIGECRDSASQARLDEAAARGVALAYMQEHRIAAYKHRGIEILRVPGHEDLRVRVISSKDGDAVAHGEA